MTGPVPVRQRHVADRDTGYPPLPDALVVPVYDNHTHLEFVPTRSAASSPSVAAESSGGGARGAEPLDYREHLDRASRVGVRGVVQVGTDVETSRWSADIAAIEPRVLAAVALHPNDAPDYAERGELEDALAIIADLAGRPRVRAVGETGLDFFRTAEGPRRDAQVASFEAHIEIAKQNGIAVQIHDRDAHAAVVATLKRVGGGERTVFHCFSGDVELVEICAENGWYMSFAGTVTFTNAPTLRAALRAAPRDLILVETDAPFLTPTPFRGRPNAPYLIPHTLRAMAEVIETDAATLAAQISSNTELVYGRWDSEPVGVPPAEPIGRIA